MNKSRNIIDLKKIRYRFPPSWILLIRHFWRYKYILQWHFNIYALLWVKWKLGKRLENGNVLTKFKMTVAAISYYWSFPGFRRYKCVPNEIRNISTTFGGYWLTRKYRSLLPKTKLASATIWNFGQCAFRDVIEVFKIEFTTFPLKLMMVDRIAKKWQQFFESQDGGIKESALVFFKNILLAAAILKVHFR